MKSAVVFSIGVFIVVCSVQADQPAPKPKRAVSVFFPLEKGHKWTYRVTDNKAAQPKADARPTVIEVEREEVFSFKESKDGVDTEIPYIGFVLKNSNGDRASRDRVVVTEGDVVHRTHVAGTALQPPQAFFRILQKWESEAKAGGTQVKGTFTNELVEVQVPAGKYKAYHITFNNNLPGDEAVEIHRWFAPDIGMVKQRVKMKSHDIVLELERFDKGK
jgi:hypothetical protein